MSPRGQILVAVVVCSPILLGVTMTLLAVSLADAPWHFVGANLAFYVLGFLLFLQAKRSVLSGGVKATVGSKRMTPSNRVLYRLGYCLMFLGALMTWILYSVTFATDLAASAA